MKIFIQTIIFSLFALSVYAQEQGVFSGQLQANGNFFQRDTTIGASNTPQYDQLKTGGEAWFNLNYGISGYDFKLRFDLYQNSNLPNPQDAFSGQGIGFWQIGKQVDKLGITVGNYYEQIGSGIVFRAYEERFLAIDNSMIGLRLTYDLNEDWRIKAFTGKQRNAFGGQNFSTATFPALVSALNVDGFHIVNETTTIAPGMGILNRSLTDDVIRNIGADISLNNFGDFFFQPQFNTYAFTAYNTLTMGDFSFYVEGAFKTREAIISPIGIVVDTTGRVIEDFPLNGTPSMTGENVHGNFLVTYQEKAGSVLFASASYSRKGFGVTLQAKRTQNFQLHVSPGGNPIQVARNFLPPMTRENSKRLTTRYNAATQELDELAFQADVQFKVNKIWSGEANFSNINTLDGLLLYRELYLAAKYKKRKTPWVLTGGLQFQQYNQEVYEVKPGVPLVQTVTPFSEVVYKFDRKKSIRAELQYLFSRQDYGQWVFALVEYSIAPKWSFSLSNMVTLDPEKFYKNSNIRINDTSRPANFYSAFVSYAEKANKFSLAYVRQPDGINCTGGVCRYEPAFSGVRMTVNSSF